VFDNIFRGPLDGRLERDRIFGDCVDGVVHFVYALPRDGAGLDVPDLKEQPHVRIFRHDHPQPQESEPLRCALDEIHELQLRHVSRLCRCAYLPQHVVGEQSRVAILINHVLVVVGEAGLVQGVQGFREADAPHGRPLLAQDFGKYEGERLLLLFLAGDRGRRHKCNALLGEVVRAERNLMLVGRVIHLGQKAGRHHARHDQQHQPSCFFNPLHSLILRNATPPDDRRPETACAHIRSDRR